MKKTKLIPLLFVVLFFISVPGSILPQIVSPGISYYINTNNLYYPGEKVSVYLYAYSYSDKFKETKYNFEFSVLKIKDVEGFYSNQTSRGNINVIGKDSSNLLYYTDEVKKFSKTIKVNKEYGYLYLNENIPLNINESGAYIVKVTLGQYVAYTGFIISRYGIVTEVGNNSVLLFAVDRKTGMPLDDAKLNFFQNGKSRLQGKTRNGVLYGNYVPEIDEKNPYDKDILVIGNYDNDIIISDPFAYYNYPSENYSVYIYTQQPVYRTGGTVNFKSLIKKREQEGYISLSYREVNVKINDSYGQKVFEEKYTTNNNGSINGTFVIPEDGKLGDYYIYVYLDENKVYSNSFTVEQYKKPEYKVTVSTDKKQYYGKDEIKASVEARYFFGSPVSDAEVEYNIYKVRYYTPWWKFSDYAWWFEDEEDEYQGDFSGAEFIYSGEGKLNGEGKFEFDYLIEEDFKSDDNIYGWWWYRDYYTDYRYIVQARVVDKSRREISGLNTVYVTRGGFYMNIKANKYFYRPEEKVTIKINAQDFFDKPVETNVKVEIYKSGWYRWSDKERKELVKVIEGRTNKDGKANLEYIIDKSNSEGYYEIKAVAFDDRGSEITATSGFYVYTGERWWWGYNESGGTQIMLDKDSYKKGDTCRVFVVTSDSNVNLLVSAKTDNILYYKTLAVPERNAYVEFILDEKFNTTFSVSASYIKNMQIHSANENIKIIPEEKFLTVELTPSKTIYKPKEEGEYTLRVLDFYGNPVPNAEVSLGVVDESIYSIKEDKTKDIRKFFYSGNFAVIGTSFNYVTTNYGYSRLITIFERFNIKSAKESELATVSGVLYSKENKTIANAIIVVDGIYYACTTGPDGEFEFKLPEGKYSVSVYTGKEEIEDVMEIKIRKGEKKTIKLFTDEKLNELYNKGMLDGLGEETGIEEQTLAPYVMERKDATKKETEKNGKGKDKEDEMVEPELRSDFRDAVIWMPYVTTDENGYAKVNVKYPDNLTEWRITSRVITEDTKVGQVIGRVITRKDLLVRMETPRFLQNEDEVTISTIVHNYLSTEKYTKLKFVSEGVELIGNNQVELNLKPNTDERIDWKIKVNNPTGEAKLYCEALTNEESDAVEIKVPIQPKGLEMFKNNIADISDDIKTETKIINIPYYADLRTVNLKFTASSSIASALLTSLDDLAGYPYGCVEQTMSRFLPSVIVANAFRELNAPISEKTKKELPNMVGQGLNKLYGFQHSDGGWGWWTNDESQPYMTAYVLYGLNIAKISGYNVSQTVINKGIGALKNHIASENEPVTKAYMLYVLSTLDEKNQSLIFNELTKLEKEELNDFALGLMALTYHNTGKDIEASGIIEKLEKSAKKIGDDLTYWEGQKFNYRWQDDKVQTTAIILKAFVNIKKDSPLTSRIVRWLLMQRQGTSWRNTQETALTVFSLVDYLKMSKELDPDFSVKIYVNNEFKFEKKFTNENIYDKDSLIRIKGVDLKSGDNEVRIEKSGKGKLYFSSVTSYFDNTGKVDASENWFRVEREYYRLEKYESYSGDKITYRKKYFGGEVQSGDVIFVKLRVFTREENLSYFMLEEPLPAGCEVVKDDWAYNIEDEKEYTGYTYYWWRWWYADKEVRDNRVTFFATYLYGKEFEFSYIMRAQIPGEYTVNPARAMLMYYPDINGNTTDIKMKITD